MFVLSDYQFDFFNLNNDSHCGQLFPGSDRLPLDDLKRLAGGVSGGGGKNRPPEPLDTAGLSCTSWGTTGSAFAAERHCDALFGAES